MLELKLRKIAYVAEAAIFLAMIMIADALLSVLNSWPII